ncbi:MAG TPA: hypothetical protein VET66_03560, partial [Steroidobacteraceae bacterium]|nr:hypothetical protein [Steroidobacteraceae bacterium]
MLAVAAATMLASVAPAVSSAVAPSVTSAITASAALETVAITSAALLLVAPVVALAALLLAVLLGRGRHGRLRLGEHAEQPREEARLVRRGGGDRLRGLRGRARLVLLLRPLRGHGLGDDRRGLVGRNGLDDRLLALDLRFGFLAGGLRFFRALDQLVARRHLLHLVQLVVLEALHLVVRGLEVRVRHQHDVDLEARLELLDLGALLVQQERRDVDRHLHMHCAGVLLHRLFLDDAQHVQCRGLGAADEAGAAATRAADVRGFLERGLQ